MDSMHYDALICFGAIMKGKTYHFDLIMNECARGLGPVMLSEDVPIIVEVIPVSSVDQLAARSRDDRFYKGIEAALATAELISWRRSLKELRSGDSHSRGGRVYSPSYPKCAAQIAVNGA